MAKAIKGDAIVSCGGTYAGLKGWLNKAKVVKDGHQVSVIVALNKEGTTTNVTTVERSSIRRASYKPSSYAKACIYKHHNIGVLMRNLCIKLAE